MSSHLRRAVEALPNPGTTGSWARRLADGLVNLGHLGDSTIGQLSTSRPWLGRLYAAMTPKPSYRGATFAHLIAGGGLRELADAVVASVNDGGDAPVPPDGFAFVVDGNGNYVTDQNGAYVIVPV